MEVDPVREFWRFYRITAIYLCIVATLVLVLLVAEAAGALPDQVPSPINSCTEGATP